MLNRIVLIGRLTKDPDLRYTPQGTPVASFRIAVDRPKSRDAERQTDFIDIVCWRQTAEFVSTYLGKGRLVAVDGRLQIREWVAQDGTKRWSTEVVATNVDALDKPRTEGEGGGYAAVPAGEPEAAAESPDFEAYADPFQDE